MAASSYNPFDNTLSNIKRAKKRRELGYVNAIPWGFNRFETVIPGVEHGRYTIITAGTKGGKSTIADDLFMYRPIEYVLDNPKTKTDYRLLYFLLEESEEERIAKMISRRINKVRDKRISPVSLYSKFENFILSDTIIDFIEQDREYYESMLSKVTFIDRSFSATSILSKVDEFALQYGDMVDGRYVKRDPNLYLVVIVDHVSLLLGDKYKAIGELSNGLVEKRNTYGISPVVIQQQAKSGESLDSIKQNRIHATVDNLADNKQTANDANYVLGITNPWVHEHMRGTNSLYKGYRMQDFKDNVRFLEIIRSRHGGMGSILPLFFDGACTNVFELPRPNDEALNDIISWLKSS